MNLEENGYYSVAYGNMAALFVNAIKELTKEVNTLSKKVIELEYIIRK